MLHLIVCFLLIVTGIFEILLFVFFSKSANNPFQHFALLKWGGITTLLLGLLLLGFLIFKNKLLTKTPVNRILRIIELLIFTTFAITAWRYEINFPAAIFGVTAAALLYALFWENNTKEKKVIVSESGIQIPKATNQSLQWYEIQNLVLRYGIITIDCLDNHLMQWNVQKTDFDEEIFNEFCKAQIAANIKNRIKNW